jgi:hypothetical protein
MTAISSSVKRKSRRDERGQVIAIAPILMLLFFGIGALAVDVGIWLVTRTKLQADADAMALAGALSLPNETEAEAKALEWGLKNGITTPANINPEEDIRFDPDPSCNKTPGLGPHFISVTVKRNGPLIFSGLLGPIVNPQIRACATAAKKIQSGLYAIFAGDECNGLDNLNLSGSGDPQDPIDVIGHVHSNCEIEISGSDYDFDGVVSCVDEMQGAWDENDLEYLQGEPDCPHPALPLPIPDPQTWNEVFSGGYSILPSAM